MLILYINLICIRYMDQYSHAKVLRTTGNHVANVY